MDLGRSVVLAAGTNDFCRLFELFGDPRLALDINARANGSGYLNYVWTPWLTQFLGDPVLHIALKQDKLLSVYALLLLGADTSVANYFKETTADICLAHTGRSIEWLRKHAFELLLPSMNLSRLAVFPKRLHCAGLVRETMALLGGRELRAAGDGLSQALQQLLSSSSGADLSLSSNGNLKYVVWDSSSGAVLADFIRAHGDVIVSLTLSARRLTTRDVEVIACSLSGAVRLEYLDLSSCCIDDDGATVLAAALSERGGRALRMTLLANRVADMGARLLVDAMLHKCGYLK